jgi:hypothetical protein
MALSCPPPALTQAATARLRVKSGATRQGSAVGLLREPAETPSVDDDVLRRRLISQDSQARPYEALVAS